MFALRTVWGRFQWWQKKVFLLQVKVNSEFFRIFLCLHMWLIYPKEKNIRVWNETLGHPVLVTFALQNGSIFNKALLRRNKIWDRKNAFELFEQKFEKLWGQSAYQRPLNASHNAWFQSIFFIDIHPSVELYTIFQLQPLHVFYHRISKVLKECPINFQGDFQRTFPVTQNSQKQNKIYKHKRKRY